MAHKADYWLPIRPGTDGALAMSWMNVIIKENLYDRAFVERWTNAPHLIDVETMAPLTESMIRKGGDERQFVVWDQKSGRGSGVKDGGCHSGFGGHL